MKVETGGKALYQCVLQSGNLVSWLFTLGMNGKGLIAMSGHGKSWKNV